jgi:glycosyltransferase involved in cell wall biosynthesis
VADLLVSVIIPAYRRPELLEPAIRSVLAQDIDPALYEVIVVDSSPDDTNTTLVASLQPESRCPLRCLTKPPEGPGPSRNLGARSAKGRFLAFMDSDCQAAPHWLRSGIAAFQESTGLVQGRTIPEPGVPHSAFNRYIAVEQETLIYETANIFYRREAFEQAGGFLADLLPEAEACIGGEDTDLAWKVKRAGWRSHFAPDALVTHAVVRMKLWRWFVDPPLYICPLIVRRYPEVRRMFFLKYFYNRAHALLLLVFTGIGLSFVSLWFLALIIPYVIVRTSERSRTLRGPLHVLRMMIYLPRDLTALALLLAGSIRYRSLLL